VLVMLKDIDATCAMRPRVALEATRKPRRLEKIQTAGWKRAAQLNGLLLLNHRWVSHLSALSWTRLM